MSALPLQVLLVEDNPGDARLLQEMLGEPSAFSTELTHCINLADALSHLAELRSHIVLLDLGLPDSDGLSSVRKVRAAAERIALVVLTGLDDEGVATQALTEGAQDYLVKGQIGAQSLLRAIRYAIERQRTQVETDEIRKLQLHLRNEFISMVSHELRTPLTSIRGALGLINGGALGKLPEKAKAMVQIAHQNSERLVRIINDILDMEKINCGGLEMRLEPVPVTEFLTQTLAVNQVYGVKHQVRFVLESAPTRVWVSADPDRLMQVMANLLSNAAKFSPPGSVVRVRATEHDRLIRIEVEDYGTGIPVEFRNRVFEKFAQADSSASRRFEGTGLGLSITRRLVEAMNGTIGFTTIADEGTTFYFELPRAAGTAELPILSEPVVVVGRNTATLAAGAGVPRILHVEDDVDLSQVIAAALGGSAVVVTARNLQQAVTLLREGSFSLLLLDLALSDGNGLMLLERLPELTAHALPVIILSASEVAHDVQQRVASTLIKSRVSEAHIVETILSWLPQRAER